MESGNPIVRVGVGVMLIKDGKVLLGMRKGEPGKGTWTMPGGKIEFGESIDQCARRETLEETGIRLKSVKVICVNGDVNLPTHFVTIGLVSDSFEGECRDNEPEKITGWRWFPMNDLPSPLFQASSRLLECYRSGAFNKY